MQFIQGVNREQISLLPDCLDDYAEADNPVRVIDAYVDSLDMGALGFLKNTPKDTGRPMCAPQDMLKLYLYGYMNRIRSSRRLESESHRNLELMWLLRKLTPDHKTIARFRRDNSTALKNVFRHFVKLCIRCELYGRELVAVDGSKFKAVNSKDRNYNSKKLKERIERLDNKIEEYVRQLEENDAAEDSGPEPSKNKVKEVLEALHKRRVSYAGMLDELSQSEETQISLTDPDSRLMMGNGKMDVSYNVQTATDSKNGLIAEFEATNLPNDRGQLSAMAQKAKDMLEVDSLAVCADKGYDSASDIVECVKHQITPHVAGSDMRVCVGSEAGGEICAQAPNGDVPRRCVYIKERNIVICPAGAVLYPRYYKKSNRAAWCYNQRACSACTNRCSDSICFMYEVAMKRSASPKSTMTKTCK